MKHYITSDKIGEFVSAMYEKGIRVDADPSREELAVQLPSKEYRWVKVFHKTSFEEMCEDIVNETSESHV